MSILRGTAVAMVLGLCLLGCAENSNGEVEQLKDQIAAMEAEIDAMSDAARVTTTTAARVVTTTRPPRTTTTVPRATTTVSHTHKFTSGEWEALNMYCSTVAVAKDPLYGFGTAECQMMVKRITGLDYRNQEASMRDCNYEDARRWIRDDLKRDPEWPVVIERECGPS